MKNLSFDQLPQAVTQLSKKLDKIERLLLEENKEQPKEEPDQLLTVGQAAEFLSLTKPTIYSKVSKGTIPVMKRGKRLYFSRKELMEYLKAGRQKTNDEIEEEAEDYLSNKNK